MKIDFSSANILVSRTDRLGDVLLATPVLARLRQFYPKAKISFLVKKAWVPILQFGSEIQIIECDPLESLSERLKEKKFDVAIVLRDEKEVSKAVHEARIPYRVGPYSSLHSFFRFNRGKFQKRSRCKMHEAEYNLALLKKIGVPFSGVAKNTDDLPRSWIKYGVAAQHSIQGWMQHHGLKPGHFYCMHPGSSGSARYLSTEAMIQLVNELLQGGNSVVLTGGAHEAALLNEIAHASATAEKKAILFGGEDPRSLDELAELYRNAKTVIAHGTGPIHLAAAVGTPAYAIFSPLQVLSERRWGPLVGTRKVWTPDVNCPEKYRCRGIKCGYYDCMSRFDVELEIKKIEQLKTMS